MRSRFRNLVVARTAEQLLPPRRRAGLGPAVRYLSVGSGGMLTDFEILCGLVERGLEIESITVADTVYRKGNRTVKAVAAFFAPARVTAFAGMSELRAAVKASPELYGRATTFMHVDANHIPRASVRAFASEALVDGGLQFELSNDGARRFGFGCWERRAEPGAAGADAVHGSSREAALDRALPCVELADDEGTVSPLGEAEPEESLGRPMWGGGAMEADGAGRLRSSAPDKNAGLTDEQLNDALNLM